MCLWKEMYLNSDNKSGMILNSQNITIKHRICLLILLTG